MNEKYLLNNLSRISKQLNTNLSSEEIEYLSIVFLRFQEEDLIKQDPEFIVKEADNQYNLFMKGRRLIIAGEQFLMHHVMREHDSYLYAAKECFADVEEIVNLSEDLANDLNLRIDSDYLDRCADALMQLNNIYKEEIAEEDSSFHVKEYIPNPPRLTADRKHYLNNLLDLILDEFPKFRPVDYKADHSFLEKMSHEIMSYCEELDFDPAIVINNSRLHQYLCLKDGEIFALERD